MLNDLPIPKMSVFGVRSPGHEGAGVVVKIGSNVTNWKVGDRAGIKPAYDACFDCELCWTGREAYCPESPQIGLQFPGSYQQYVSFLFFVICVGELYIEEDGKVRMCFLWVGVGMGLGWG